VDRIVGCAQLSEFANPNILKRRSSAPADAARPERGLYESDDSVADIEAIREALATTS